MNESLPGILIAVVVFGGIGLATKDDIKAQYDASRALRAQSQKSAIVAAETGLAKVEMEQTLKSRDELRSLEVANANRGNAIARTRYESNCRSPQAENGLGITLVEGMQLVDPMTGYPLQKGTPVCDSSGNTGIVADNGIVTQFARLTDTPKRVLSRETFDRYFKPVPASQIRSGRSGGTAL